MHIIDVLCILSYPTVIRSPYGKGKIGCVIDGFQIGTILESIIPDCLQSLNVLLPIEVTPSGILVIARSVHPLNALSLIAVNPLGKEVRARLVHPLNAL